MNVSVLNRMKQLKNL